MFQKLSSILHERAHDRVILQEAAKLRTIRHIWEQEGVPLFPQHIQEHLRANVRPGRLLRNIALFEVTDAHTKNALLLQQQEILALVQKQLPEIRAIRLTFPR